MECKAFVKENDFMPRGVLDFGWGNGYVAIPKGHPLFEVDYNEIQNNHELSINGGLTFSSSSIGLNWVEIPQGYEESWIIGFDTMHLHDTLDRWPKEAVEKEAERLATQINAIN